MSDPHYKKKMRVRVCGLLKESDRILMVQFKSPVTNELVWMLPGGGLHFGEKMKTCLKREFREETGLIIEPVNLLAVNEVVQSPFHAIECYFKIKKIGGKLQLGYDPEHGDDEQIIRDLQWMPIDQLSEKNFVPKQIKKWARNDYVGDGPNFHSQEV